jgi:hypothetical protein
MAGGTNGPPVLNGVQYTRPSSTLANLRNDLLVLLGFPDPLTSVDSETQTLVELRETVIRRLGHRYAAGSNAPGVDELVDNFINEAQQSVFRMAEMDKAGSGFPAIMTLDADPTEIDYKPVLTLAIAYAKAHYGQGDAQAYFSELEKYMRDRALRRPPNILDMATKWLQLAQKQLYEKYRVLHTDRWWKIPITAGNRFYDVPAVSSGALTDITFADANPDTITRASGSWYDDGFNVGMKIKASGAAQSGNNDTQWTIDSMTSTVLTLAAGDAVVAEGAGASVTINTMDYMSLNFRRSKEAWIEDNGTWHILRGPIPAQLFNIDQQTIPTHYQLREYFEIFPEPDKAYTAYVRGHFGLLPFASDNDITTIDSEPILLQATVWGKRHFRHPDAPQWERDLRDLVGHLNAGTFAGKRYIPEPKEPPPPLSYPQVTWQR